LLGGEEWVRAADLPIKDEPAVFLGNAWEDPEAITFDLVLTTRRLLPNTYPQHRVALADRVVRLRDIHAMTFKAIATILSAERLCGARGATLKAENVFAMYKKRKTNLSTRTPMIEYSIENIIVYPAHP
jgi:hypothetical protein